MNYCNDKPHLICSQWPGLPARGRWHMVASAALIFLVAPVGATSAEPDAPPLLASQDGIYVFDPRSQLAWARCVEGMTWNGSTCTGEPILATRAQALTLANSRAKRDGVKWRLPTAAQWRGLLSHPKNAQGLDASLFPQAPLSWHWTATINVDTANVNQYNYANVMKGANNTNANRLNPSQGWAVNAATGQAAGDTSRQSKLAVRLVVPSE